MASKSKPSATKSGTSSPAALKPFAVTPPDPQVLMMEVIQKTLQEALQQQTAVLEGKFKGEIQELKKEMGDVMLKRNTEIREDIVMAFQGLAKHMIRLDERVEEVNQSNLNLEIKVEDVQSRMETTEQELVMAQYRAMEFALRIRGLKENKGENLREIFVEAFAQIMEKQQAELEFQIDKIYRVNSWIARQRQLPRDIVIYFTTRWMRNEILQLSYKNKVRAATQEVLVLKEIPPKMLKNRKDFSFLVNELRNRQIQFRWEAPAGIVVNYLGERYRLNSIWKARDFYTNILKAENPPGAQGQKERKQPQAEGGTPATEQDLLQVSASAQSWQLGDKIEDPKDQRLTRAATKRKEEDSKKQEAQMQAQDFIKNTSEAVGGARPKKLQEELQSTLSMLRGAKNGN